MKKSAIAFLVVALVAVCGISAHADTITQVKEFDGTPDYTKTLTFDEFDDLGGTLVLDSVEVIMDMEASGGQYILDNDGEDPATGSFQFGADGAISSTDVPLLDSSFQPVIAQLVAADGDTFNLDGNVGDGPGDYDPTPPDGMQYDGGTESDSDSGFIGSAFHASFIGTGSFEVDVDAGQYSTFGGVSGIEYAVTPVTTEGTVTIIYNSHLVPEPTTFLMLATGALGLLACAWRRRRR